MNITKEQIEELRKAFMAGVKYADEVPRDTDSVGDERMRKMMDKDETP